MYLQPKGEKTGQVRKWRDPDSNRGHHDFSYVRYIAGRFLQRVALVLTHIALSVELALKTCVINADGPTPRSPRRTRKAVVTSQNLEDASVCLATVQTLPKDHGLHRRCRR